MNAVVQGAGTNMLTVQNYVNGLPQTAPAKVQPAFARMSNSDTQNYQQLLSLIQQATQNGICPTNLLQQFNQMGDGGLIGIKSVNLIRSFLVGMDLVFTKYNEWNSSTATPTQSASNPANEPNASNSSSTNSSSSTTSTSSNSSTTQDSSNQTSDSTSKENAELIGSILASAGKTKLSRIQYLSAVPFNAPTLIQEDCPEIFEELRNEDRTSGNSPLKSFLKSANDIYNTRETGRMQMMMSFEKAKAQVNTLCGENGSLAVAYLTALFKIANLAFSN